LWLASNFPHYPDARGQQRAAAFPSGSKPAPHTEAPTGLSQPARCFPESRLRAARPRFSRGSTIITFPPLVFPAAASVGSRRLMGRSYYSSRWVPRQLSRGGFCVLLAHGGAVIVPVVRYDRPVSAGVCQGAGVRGELSPHKGSRWEWRLVYSPH